MIKFVLISICLWLIWTAFVDHWRYYSPRRRRAQKMSDNDNSITFYTAGCEGCHAASVKNMSWATRIKGKCYQWCICVCCICSLTLVETYDVGVPERGSDLDLSLDVYSVQVIGDALLTDGLDGHLRVKIVLSLLQNRVSKMTFGGFILKKSSRAFLSLWANSSRLSEDSRVSLIRLSTILVVVLYFHRWFGASQHRFLFN